MRFNKLTVERSLGHQKFHWNKIAARYYDFVKPLYVNVGNKGKEVADNKGEDATIEDEDKKEAWVLVEK